MNIPNLDEMEVGDFSYLNWWDLELQKCFSFNDLTELYEEYVDRIDENMMQLFSQRREELSVNPAEQVRRGLTLSQKEINHAVLIIANRND